MGRDQAIAPQFREDSPCKLLSQLHTPLVKAEDVPDNSLNKDFMLVHRDEASKRHRGELPEQDGVGRSIALEDPVG